MFDFSVILLLAGIVAIIVLFSRVRALQFRAERQDELRRAVERRLALLEQEVSTHRASATAARAAAMPTPAEARVTSPAIAEAEVPPRLVTPTGGEAEATPDEEFAAEEAEDPDRPSGWNVPAAPATVPPLVPPMFAQTAAAKPSAWAAVDWERFMGVRLFAWLGGLALFLAVAYFVKYSFDRNLIPPSVRVAMGLAMGAGLLVGGVTLRRREYEVTAQTLCATGVVVLYAALFAGHGFYHLSWFTQQSTFLLMALVTTVAFVLAVRMPALVVAILGMLGGFLTPLLLSSGRDQPVELFSYIALLDAGLIAVALKRRWHFLSVLGAVATAAMEFGWAAKFFAPDRAGLAFVIFAGFTVLFLVGLAVARRLADAGEWLGGGAAVAAAATLVFGAWQLGLPELAVQPGKVFAFVLVADLALLLVAWWRARLAPLHAVAGGVAFLLVLVWMANSLSTELLGWGLGLSLVFALLHAGFPLLLQRCRPGPLAGPIAQVFPPLTLVMLLVPLLKLETPSFAIWPVVLLVNLIALALAAVSSGLIGAFVALLLSGLASAIWIGRLPTEAGEVGGALLIVVGCAALFAGAGVALLRLPRPGGADPAGSGVKEDAFRSQLPVVATLLPFLLLAQLAVHVRLPEPSALFAGVALILAMLFALTVWLRHPVLPLAGLVGLSLVEAAWALRELGEASHPGWLLIWVGGFQLVFAAFPILFLSGSHFGRRDADAAANGDPRSLPWVAAALAGLPQCWLGYEVIERYWPNEVMGLVPLAFAVPAAVTFQWILRNLPAEHPRRLARLAWFGGVTLFFATTALPVQFERQWLTIGFALEGAALLALFRRVPHPGLRLVGTGLLLAVFARLLLNPFVFEYAVRGSVPLVNWWLYTYGLAAASLYAGAWLLRPGTDQVLGSSVRVPLVTGATVLLFALVNLEIADFFTAVGERVSFEFSGNFGRDMTYTIAWALFALGLVITGLSRRLVAARWSGLGLLALATAKLFLHDLARLDQLYRIGALAGVALVAIAASVLYQRFVAREEHIAEPR